MEHLQIIVLTADVAARLSNTILQEGARRRWRRHRTTLGTVPGLLKTACTGALRTTHLEARLEERVGLLSSSSSTLLLLPSPTPSQLPTPSLPGFSSMPNGTSAQEELLPFTVDCCSCADSSLCRLMALLQDCPAALIAQEPIVPIVHPGCTVLTSSSIAGA